MKEEINLYDILRYAPTGMKLFTPEFGWLYLHTVSKDNYRNGWLGDDIAIKLTKRKPRYERHQIGGNAQYKYEEINYCFDRYGRMYLTDPRRAKHDDYFLKAGEQYLYNGRKFLTTDCQIFPDETMTWDNWQKKLFMPGDLVVIPLSPSKYRPFDKYIFTGIVKELPKFSGARLVDWTKEEIRDNCHYHSFKSRVLEFGGLELQKARFAGHQDWMEWNHTKCEYEKKLNNVKIK